MTFEIFGGNTFETLKFMVECEYHIMSISTYGFWIAFLNSNQHNSKVFYPSQFVQSHTDNMIPYKEWQML
jgi:hypothetical protein